MSATTTRGDWPPARWSARDELSDTARQILGRTISGAFACQIWNVSNTAWRAALHELLDAGCDICWTYGTVADDPSVTGGWVLR